MMGNKKGKNIKFHPYNGKTLHWHSDLACFPRFATKLGKIQELSQNLYLCNYRMKAVKQIL